LSVEPDVEVVGEAVDGLEAIEQVERLAPDVVVMDISMPRLNGVEATRRIREAFPQVTVVGLSMHAADYMARPTLEAGAATFLDKSMPAETFPIAIRLAARGERTR
jgi:DNA-binding NarL/FixJ family response regulator